MEDRELLRQFVQQNSQDAFRELVARHTDWLYCVCLRRLRDSALAEDATQAIFLALARRAPGLLKLPTLSPWLHRAAKFVTSNLQRAQHRRARHESEAASMNLQSALSTDDAWEAIEADLEPALDRLGARDREIILLRFYEKKTHEQIAALLHISGAAAQKRLSRALERLRDSVARRRGVKSALVVTLTAGAFGSVLHSHAVGAVSPAIVSSIANCAAAAPSAHLTLLAKGILRMTALAQAKVAIAVAAVALLIAIPGSVLCFKMTDHASSPEQILAKARASSAALAGDSATAFDADAFNAMNNWDRMRFVMARLKERDKLLENIPFKVDEDIMNPNADGSWTVMEKDKYDVRRLESSYWVHHQRGNWRNAEGLRDDEIFAWDGKSGFIVPSAGDRPVANILVQSPVPNELADLLFIRVAGTGIGDLRTPKPDRSISYDFFGTLPSWFDSLMDRETPFTVTLESDNQTIKVEFKNPGRRIQTVWISTAKGYMVSKLDDRDLGANESYLATFLAVQASEEHAGIWLPQKVLSENAVGNPSTRKISQEYQFVAHDFQLGTLASADVQVTFPVDCTIMDSARGVRYTINADGTFTLLRFTKDVPSEPGTPHSEFPSIEVHTPPEDAIVRHIDDSTAALYTTTVQQTK